MAGTASKSSILRAMLPLDGRTESMCRTHGRAVCLAAMSQALLSLCANCLDGLTCLGDE